VQSMDRKMRKENPNRVKEREGKWVVSSE
jgi:hypothetical protein